MYKFTLHTIYAPKRSNLPFTSIISYKLHTTYLLGQQVSYKLTFHSYVPYLELHFLMDGLGFINPVPHGPASQQNLGPADNVANDAQLLGRPKIPNDRPEGRSNLRPEGLAWKERRSLPTPARLSDRKASLPTPACLSDQKAWLRRNDAHF